MLRSLIKFTLLCAVLSLCTSAGAAEPKQTEKPRYQIREIRNTLGTEFNQAIPLIDSGGRQTLLDDLLTSDVDKPVVMQFIFTSCSNVCPIMSTIMQAIQSDVADQAQLISISIDPENDDPDELHDYATQFEAQPHWRFFTGELDDIIRLQKRLNVYQQNKMRHQPITFILSQQRLYRIDGLPSREDTLEELYKVINETGAQAQRLNPTPSKT